MITQLKLDESTKLEFGVSITGADSSPVARFIIEGTDFSIMLKCTPVNESVEVEIPALKNLLPAGEYPVRLEVVIDNKLYTPLQEQIIIEPSIAIATKQKPAVKESVKVAKITVKKTQLDENLLRKTQAAMIIAAALDYKPEAQETPTQVIENAIAGVGHMTQEQQNTVNEMLDLAETVGLNVDRNIIVEFKPVVQTEIIKKSEPVEDEDSDDEIDQMIDGLKHEDFLAGYDDHEFGIYSDDGELLEENLDEMTELNEVLSRVERMKARVRMARNKHKLHTKLNIALHKRSSASTLNHRARRIAIEAMKKKIAKRPLDTLSASEKERVERIIERRKAVINRMAMKLIPKVRQVEKDRLKPHS